MQEQNAATVTESKKCSLGCRFIHLIVVLLIVVGFAYFAWQNYQTRRQMTAQIQQLQQQLQEREAAIDLAKANIEQYLKSQGSELSWALPEAQYLIRLANISLVISHNVSLSMQLLTMADQRLSTLSDSNIVSVRQALASDIGALKMVPNVDTIGIVLKINALNDQILKLPTANLPSKLPEPTNIQTKLQAELSKTFWQKFDAASWQQLQNIIIVKHHEQPVQSLLSEEQQINLIQKMQLALNQAEWAVLYKQTMIYRESLQKVIDLANLYFSNNPTAATDIIKTIKELQLIELTPKIPEITTSLQAIHKAMTQLSPGKAL